MILKQAINKFSEDCQYKKYNNSINNGFVTGTYGDYIDIKAAVTSIQTGFEVTESGTKRVNDNYVFHTTNIKLNKNDIIRINRTGEEFEITKTSDNSLRGFFRYEGQKIWN